MGKILRLLHVEDSERDAALLSRHLTAAGYDLVSERVETAAEMKAALEPSEWDIILCDYSMPQFNALSALKVLQDSGLDIPLIIISGTVGEDVAVEAMRAGAQDYLMKDNLVRLVPIIERELQDKENRRVQGESEAALKASEAELRALFQTMSDVILILDSEGRHLKVAPTRPTQSYKQNVHRLGKTVHEIFPAEVADLFLRNVRQSLDEARILHVEYSLAIDGQDVWFDATVTPMTEDSVMWVAREITERKRAENERRVIFDIIQGVVTTPNLDEFLKLVHRSIGELVYAENCFVKLHDHVTGMSHFEFWVDKHDPRPDPRPLGKGFSGYVLRTGEPLMLTEESKKRIIDAGEAEQVGSSSQSWLGVPLRTPERTIGVLVIQHYKVKNAYDQRDLEFLSSVGDQIALAIERKRAEDTLHESEERYRDLVENAIDIIYTRDLKGNYTSVNRAAEKITGYTREESLTINMAQTVAPEYREKAKQMLAAELVGDGVTAYELEMIAKDGSQVAVEVSTRVIFENGVPIGVQGIARDITERKQQEDARRASERKYQDIFDLAPVGIYRSLLDGTLLTVNNALAEMMGYDSASELLNTNIAGFYFNQDEREMFVAEYSNVGRVFDLDLQWKRRDGSPIWIQLTCRQITEATDGQEYFEGFVRDVTESKLMSEALYASETRLRTIIDTEPECVKLLAKDGSLLEMNPAGLRMIEADSFAEVANHSVFDLIDEHDRKAFADLTKKVFRGEPGMLEFQLVGLKGTQRWLDTHASPLRDANGEIVALLAITRDVTERKLGEAAREASERKYQDLFRLAPVGIYQSQADGTVTTANFTLARMLGYDTVDEFLGTNFADIYFHPDDRTNLFDRYLEKGLATDIDFQWKRKDGSPVWIQLTAHAIKGHDGEIEYFEGFVRDITKQKADEDNLRESDEKFHQLADNISDVFWIRSPDMAKIYYISPAFEQIWGRSIESLLADPHAWAEFVYSKDRPRVKKAFDALQKDSSSLDIEYRIVRPDDSLRWVRVRGFPVKDSRGTLIRVAGIVSDTTERKEAAEALVDSEERYRELVENALDIIYTHDLQGNYTSVNRAAETISGYTKAEVMAMNMADTIPAEQLERAKKMIASKLAGEDVTAYELDLIAKDGSRVPVEVNSRIIFENGVPTGVQGIARDITERKAAEKQLWLQASALDAAANAIVITDIDGTIAWVNPAFTTITGYTADEAIGQNPRILKSGKIDEAFYKTMWDTVLSGRSWQGELTNRRKDGSTYSEQQTITPVMDDGEITNFIAIKQDITERKLAEAALAAAEENYRSIFENAVEGIFQSTSEGRFISANPAMARILGFDSPEELLELRTDIGRQHYVDPESRIELSSILENEGVVVAYECEVYKKDGTKILTQENIRAIRGTDGGILHYEGSLEDITERKTLEDQFRQSQKMEAVGVMAGGIAHDFNNLLTAINGYSDLTLRKMAPDEPLRRNIEEVKKAGDRATELTSQLLAFSRKQVLNPVVHNLNSVIGNIENMLRRIIRENVELRTVLDADLGNIKADPGQMEQVIINLAVNARDAMPDGGTLTIETHDVYLDEQYSSQKLAIQPGHFARLTVTDTGHGMNMDTQKHIFEPFFTTKDVGKGTGLGLAMVYGIVKQSGGDIMVYSEPGHGTTFKIYLPSVDEHEQKPKWTGDTPEEYSGTETILLVEDEEVVRHLVSDILTANGYTVLEAANGKAALDLLASNTAHIDMLLTDVIMPKMSGVELKEAVIQTLPDIKVLFMSGYTDDAIATRGVLDTNTAFLEKPFAPDALSRKVREVLES